MSNNTPPPETKRETPPAKPAAKPGPLDRMSPQDCAKVSGGIRKSPVSIDGEYFTDYRHGMAKVIHGWSLHEYHEGGPPMLTIADYKAALKVAESYPYKPHKPAMTKYAPAEYRKASA